VEVIAHHRLQPRACRRAIDYFEKRFLSVVLDLVFDNRHANRVGLAVKDARKVDPLALRVDFELPYLAVACDKIVKQVLVDTTKKLQTTKYSAGQMVFEQGDAPDRFYIISSGEVEVIRRKRDGSEKILAVLHPGDYFGEIGLLTEARRNASIRAKTDVELLAMNWDDFRRVIESSEVSRKDFADIMRERLAQT
jgi:hypothetical protein